MAQLATILSVFAISYISLIIVSSGEIPKTYDELYNSGIEAYTSEDWYGTIDSLEKAIAEFKFYRSSLATCRLRCNNVTSQFEDGYLEQFDDLFFFDRVLRKAECLTRCKDKYLGHRPERISQEITNDFVLNVPYSYLQMAYYKTDQMEKAASAAYTFLLANPDDVMMNSNMDWYQANSGIENLVMEDMEAKPHQINYMQGQDAYGQEDWSEAIDYFEQSLEEFYKVDGECRSLCEGPHEYEEFQDLYISIGTHYHSVVNCRLNCFQKTSVLEGKFAGDFLPSIYHYLQYAYFQVGEPDKAVQCAVSYLLFLPEDEVMTKNMEFYETQTGINVDSYQPRDDAKLYHSRVTVEDSLKKFADSFMTLPSNVVADTPVEEFSEKKKGDIDDIDANNIEDDVEGEDVIIETSKAKYFGEIQNDDDDDVRSNMDNVTIVMTEKELNGTLRMVADLFASQMQCDQLIELALAGAVEGDGYSGKAKPHTTFETFSGLTVLNAAEKAREGLVKAEDALLYLDLSEKARRYVESYFKLPTRLFFSYTHLVCREAEPDAPQDRDDLSHPIHADNCWLDDKGNCIKKSPAYVWRDYSALMYLNEDFEGGEFIFARFNKTVEASVQPKCGRLVSFSAGEENLHGVKAVTKGRRCALAMWYTLDTKYDEKAHIEAREILENLQHDELYLRRIYQ
ncbi:leprecan-like protein precursor [Saccoglossus kowalevskii]|uniref:procollagen-proline 3-dioxygenase n=1 Tax=Saccoglossus kowalevskii TaxID=10224 RepID=D1LX56_SACKO|nr:leprecan-like protein precursor [Saccoglossus kowalevskii]ACY92562.1 leprecan-like protein [Saccoglossus kowalevskii]